MPPASASAVNNNSNNAAAQAAAKAEREEKLRGALKAFILKDRQRKKEEFEAKIEEERKRREREARERENDMTLEETRAQIAKLDEKLTELRDQKQQLFLQLKIVLNEDETRKKEQKDRELALAQQASAAPQQVFLPPVRTQHHQMPMIPKQVSNQPVKRGRSPSPPSTHQGYYKSTSYSQPKYDDGRARVLWNKPTTPYQNPGTLFYQTTSNAPQPPPTADTRGPALIYPQYNLPLRQGYHLELQQPVTVQTSKTDQSNAKPTQVYHINLDQPTIQQAGVGAGPATVVQSQKPQVTMEKINDRYHEVKHESVPQGSHVPSAPHGLGDNVVFTALMPGMPLLPNVLQIGQNLVQNAKGGASISQGYAQARGVGASPHEQQMARQQQMSVMQGQQAQASQQPMHYQRRLL